MGKVRVKRPQLASETDRQTLRDYLNARAKKLRMGIKRAGEREEAAYFEGAEMEILCIYDELLGEQVPEVAKKARAN